MYCSQLLGQEQVASWLPLDVGNRWTYEHEVLSGTAAGPEIVRWTTDETIVGLVHAVEGTVVRRRIVFNGHPDTSWLAGYGESSYLIRANCIYLVPESDWDSGAQQLRPKFRDRLLNGQESPMLCFPLTIDKEWGSPDLGTGWHVVGFGRGDKFAPPSVKEQAFHIVSNYFTSGDTMHIWFQRGIGITGEWAWHNGTYFELRVRLLSFEPVVTRRE